MGVLALALCAMVPLAASANMADVVEETYSVYSVAAPTPATVYICHGFGCKYRTEINFTAKDHATLAGLMAAGTRNHVAAAGAKYMFDVGQFDCIDASRNTTSLLLVLAQLKLLRHHSVDVPVSRGFLIDGRPPHYTAVLVDTANGVKWAVDSWTRGYGQAPEVMTLARWLSE